jgi:hypothetical protein
MQWFSDLVARQPVYTDLPSDFVVPDPVEHLEDPFRVLSQLIREFNEQSSLKVIVYEISKIALSVAQLYIDSDGLPPEAFIRALEDDVVRDFSILVSNPLGDGSLELRKAMSSINVRSLVRLLLHYLRVQDREHRTLCYTVHRTIVIQAIAALDNPAHRTRFIDLVVDHNELNWGHLLIGGIVEWWAPFDFQRVWLDGADEDDAGEDGIDEDAGNLGLETTSGIYNEEPDLEFFASLVTTNSGEECAICQDLLSDDTYGVPMKLNVCSHVFHHDCILKHVKGTASYSNKCPMCREEIYHSRERAHCEYKKLT